MHCSDLPTFELSFSSSFFHFHPPLPVRHHFHRDHHLSRNLPYSRAKRKKQPSIETLHPVQESNRIRDRVKHQPLLSSLPKLAFRPQRDRIIISAEPRVCTRRETDPRLTAGFPAHYIAGAGRRISGSKSTLFKQEKWQTSCRCEKKVIHCGERKR